jgi:hypothetical protein
MEETLHGYVSGEQDQQLLASIDSELGRLHAALALAEKKRHAATIAAIHVLRADQLESRAVITGEVDDARGAVEALKAAGEAWDGLDPRSTRVGALMRLAMLEAKASSPALDAVWKREARQLGTGLTMHEAAADPQSLAAMRAQRSLAEAVELAKSMEDPDLDRTEWILAKVTGDAELERRTAGASARSLDRIETDLRLKLAPTSKALIKTKALFP